MLLTRPEKLKAEHHELLAKLTAACAEMTQLAAAIRDFAPLLSPHADNADMPHLYAFARGLERDREAVDAALTLPYRNGRPRVSTPSPSASRARRTDEQASLRSATASSSDSSHPE